MIFEGLLIKDFTKFEGDFSLQHCALLRASSRNGRWRFIEGDARMGAKRPFSHLVFKSLASVISTSSFPKRREPGEISLGLLQDSAMNVGNSKNQNLITSFPARAKFKTKNPPTNKCPVTNT
jgi:hypothetical protein